MRQKELVLTGRGLKNEDGEAQNVTINPGKGEIIDPMTGMIVNDPKKISTRATFIDESLFTDAKDRKKLAEAANDATTCEENVVKAKVSQKYSENGPSTKKGGSAKTPRIKTGNMRIDNPFRMTAHKETFVDPSLFADQADKVSDNFNCTPKNMIRLTQIVYKAPQLAAVQSCLTVTTLKTPRPQPQPQPPPRSSLK